MPDLAELEAVLHPPTGPATAREDVETAIQALLFHQFIYADTRGAGRSYDLVRRHRRFFEAFFSAMGHRLLFDPRDAMISLLPGKVSYARQQTRLDRDETMALLALRFVLEAGVMQGRLTETGRVEATTDELFDAIKTLSQTEPPGEARMADILAAFRRRGLVRVEPRDTAERVTPITILPAVRHVCTDEFARGLTEWASAETGRQGDALDFIQARDAAAGDAAAGDAAADDPAAGDPAAERGPADDAAGGPAAPGMPPEPGTTHVPA